MVSLRSSFCKSLLNFLLEKKLAIALKTILILEAIAKAVIIVKGTLIEGGTLL